MRNLYTTFLMVIMIVGLITITFHGREGYDASINITGDNLNISVPENVAHDDRNGTIILTQIPEPKNVTFEMIG